MAESNPMHLKPSALGTKAYWDSTYSDELNNFASDHSQIGTVWFADSAAEEKVSTYLESDLLGLDKERSSFLDLGTGNGSMLFLLREEGWNGHMVGVDYSHGSIELARRVAEEQDFSTGAGKVQFEEWDIFSNATPDWLRYGKEEGFDVVLDKGTFDAISLSDEVDAQGKRLFESYRARVERLVKKGGLLLVTSCNWTEEELKVWFAGGELAVMGRIKYPSFTFGGVSGQSISSICFRRIR